MRNVFRDHGDLLRCISSVDRKQREKIRLSLTGLDFTDTEVVSMNMDIISEIVCEFMNSFNLLSISIQNPTAFTFHYGQSRVLHRNSTYALVVSPSIAGWDLEYTLRNCTEKTIIDVWESFLDIDLKRKANIRTLSKLSKKEILELSDLEDEFYFDHIPSNPHSEYRGYIDQFLSFDNTQFSEAAHDLATYSLYYPQIAFRDFSLDLNRENYDVFRCRNRLEQGAAFLSGIHGLVTEDILFPTRFDFDQSNDLYKWFALREALYDEYLYDF